VTEILAHLADVEIVQGFRIRLILGSSALRSRLRPGGLGAYSDYASHDIALSMDGYRVNRERTLRLLQSLPAENGTASDSTPSAERKRFDAFRK